MARPPDASKTAPAQKEHSSEHIHAISAAISSAITVVQNAMNLNGIGSSLQAVIIGAIILVAVGLDRWRAELARACLLLLPKSLRSPAE